MQYLLHPELGPYKGDPIPGITVEITSENEFLQLEQEWHIRREANAAFHRQQQTERELTQPRYIDANAVTIPQAEQLYTAAQGGEAASAVLLDLLEL